MVVLLTHTLRKALGYHTVPLWGCALSMACGGKLSMVYLRQKRTIRGPSQDSKLEGPTDAPFEAKAYGVVYSPV